MKIKIPKFSQKDILDTLITCTFLIILCQAIPTTLFGNEALTTMMIFVGFILSLILFIIVFGTERKGLSSAEIAFFILMFLSQMISSFINGNSEFTGVVLGLRYVFIAILTVQAKLNYKIILLAYYSLYTYIIYMLFTGNAVSSLTYQVSYNSITVIGVSLLALSYIAAHQNGRNIQIIQAIVLLFTAVWVGTRTGIIIGVFLVICLLFFAGVTREKKVQRAKMLLSIVVVCGIVIFLFSKTSRWEEFLFQYTYKTSHGGSLFDDVRWQMVAEYVDECLSNPVYFLIGGSYSEIHLIHLFENNPHNMFISLHANYGLLGFLMVIFFLIKTGVIFYKKNKVYLFVLIALVFSGFGNICGFPGLYDTLTFYLILVACFRERTRKANLVLEGSAYALEGNGS